ncbi:hypothetical protein [Salmonella phage SD-13_S19]|nr:hypothetical protein IsfPm1_gp2 [Proteus phage Isf-Pm1]WPK20250.1 hypothetical protein [Salmonella phage SD-11_S17]WPK20297.1 hypothetical protein [Salmonella phage SD-12_S18]WPK20432.1 hypothetical protein [Salmonella phage SD-13_S19]WPK20521.1 hypothetical protein [Salmonella phage SD-14_S20]
MVEKRRKCCTNFIQGFLTQSVSDMCSDVCVPVNVLISLETHFLYCTKITQHT